MASHVCLRQLDSYGENADGEDDARKFERYGICGFMISAAPAPGVKDVGAIWP